MVLITISQLVAARLDGSSSAYYPMAIDWREGNHLSFKKNVDNGLSTSELSDMKRINRQKFKW